MTEGTRKTHDFCWFNVMTREAEPGRAFFRALLGWSYGEMPGVPGGQLIEVDGHAIGAFMDLDLAQLPPGTPAGVGVLIKVESADATSARAAALGGRGGPASDALDNGRMARCADPCGAVFGLWQAKKERGTDVDRRAHGAPSWFETLTSDAGRAAAFYTELFGWRAEQVPMPDGRTYTNFSLDGVPIAGALPIDESMGAISSHWGIYFAVTDVDQIASRATELGGTLCMPARDIPGIGRFALLRSPQGVAFHVIQYTS